MIKKLISAVVLGAFLSSCAMVQDYDAPQGTQTSRLVMTRDLKDPLLGSSTTVYKLAERACGTGMNPKTDYRLMVLDKGNPLVSELNANGVYVDSGVPLHLNIVTIAGPLYSCAVPVDFTPNPEKDYEIKLLGRVDTKPHECRAELWSTKKGSSDSQQESVETYSDCND